MKQKLLSVIIILAMLLGPLSNGQAVHTVKAAALTCYVDTTAALGANKGSSWADAYLDLQSALADTNCTEIHVAAGIYYPDSVPNIMATFQLRNGLAIIGGYLPGGSDLPDPVFNVTTLDGNSGLGGDPDYFSLHVVTGGDEFDPTIILDSTAVLDGFTITNGSAMGDMPERGGGMAIYYGSPTLKNLVITNNSTDGGGGGIYLLAASPILTDITIISNGGPSGGPLYGGGLWNDGNDVDGYGSPVLTRVAFSYNTGDDGGGMYSSGGDPILTDVNFVSNQASSGNGGGLYIEAGNVSLSDSQVGGSNPSDGNSANDGGGIYIADGTLAMQNTTIQNGLVGGNGGGMFINYGGTATIRGGTIQNNSAFSRGGGLYISGTIAMAGTSITGNNGQAGGGGIALAGTTSAEFSNLILNGNQASGGGWGGGVHADTSTARFTNLVVMNSYSHQGGGMAFESSDITIINATFFSNNADNPGYAIYNDNLLTIANTIVWNHFSAPSINSATTVSGSLLEDGCPPGAVCSKLINSDPLFVDEQNLDLRLRPISPAIDAGDVTFLPPDIFDLDGDGNVTERISQDLRGKVRVAIGEVDIGTYEVQAGNINWTEATDIQMIEIQPDVYTNSLPRYLDRQGQSQWFKFTIQPDSKVVIALTNLAANYDLTLYKDITQAFDELNSSQDLVTLSAEFAPDTFSPDTFSPDTFSPDTFSPDTFSPDTFSPDTFSPDTFSPDTFSPDTFSPDTFSPDTFSPDTFSPDTFSPDTFSPDTFSPDTFSPDTFSPDTFSPDTFSSAQTRSLIAVSAHEGTQGEGIIVNTWTKTGDFYLRVRGRNGAYNTETPFHLKVTMLGGSCSSVLPVLPASDTGLTAAGSHSLILTNLGQTEGADAEKSLLLTRLDAVADRTLGQVLDVSADARVAAATAQAQASPACVYAMNLQAEAIKGIADDFRTLNPDLEYIVLVGNDHAFPFFRYPDNALLASEIDYAPPVLDDTTSQASLKSGYILSQDTYGSSGDISYKSGELPIPDLAVGRLVETASDINHMLDAYLGTAAGVVTPLNALVTGYDFLADDAYAVRDELLASLSASAVDTLIMDGSLSPEDPSAWTADDLHHSLLDSPHDVVFLAGHFSASSALAADYTTRLTSAEVLASGTDFINSLVYSAGCHSGYNIVNGDGVPGVTGEPDWAQVFATKGATFIGGTGYQYGDTDFIEYSERLYLEFTRQLRYGSEPVSVGKALVQAKQAYLAATPLMRGIHEKSVLEATLFGLPMLQFNLTGRIPAPVDTSLVTDTTAFSDDPGLTLGLEYADLDVAPTFTGHTVLLDQASGDGGKTSVNVLNTTVTAYYLEGPDGMVVNPAEPVLPLDLLNVTSPTDGFILRGVGWRGGDYTDLPGILPLTGAATEDLRAPHTAFFSDIFYPVRPWNINYFDALGSSAGATRLALMPAQYRSSSPGSLTGFLRRFDTLNFRLYYSGNFNTYTTPGKAWTNTPALSGPPDISRVITTINPDGSLSFEVTVTGDPAAGIQQAWIVYTFETGSASGTWLPLDLKQDLNQDPVDTRLWKGTLSKLDLGSNTAADLRFIVQAVNGVGLVTMMTNQGAFYRAGLDPATLPQGQLTSSLALESPAASGAYSAQQSFSALVTHEGTPLSGLPITFTLGGMSRFAVTGGDGRATVNFYLAVVPDDYTLDATFNGNESYGSSDDSSPFTVQPGASEVVLYPVTKNVSAGTQAEFTTTLTSSGVPVSGKTVALTLESGGTVLTTSVAVTDYAGQTTFTVPGQPEGTYSLTAWFALPITASLDLSNPYYAGSFDTASLTVNQKTNYTVFLPLILNRPFNFRGFFPPLLNPPFINIVRAGFPVPVIFGLGGDFGLNIFANGYPTMVPTTCTILTADLLESQLSSATGSAYGLTYNPYTNLYTYIWKTDQAWASTCGSLVVKFVDGTVKSVLFYFMP
jgi:hypothetical protein